jgi:hypothetical protein
VHARLAVGCCADGRRGRARRITTAACANGAPDPILLAVAHGELALARGDRVMRRTSPVDPDGQVDPVLILEGREDLPAVFA